MIKFASLQQFNLRQLQKFEKMLNPKYMLQLEEALQLIINPHQKYRNLNTTQCIQCGQQLLNQLRYTPSYACLLSHYLTNSSSTLQKSSNQLKFILLQLFKLIPLHNQIIWWHLLQFYYSCNQRLENMIIDIIVRHFKMKDDQFRNAYLPFLRYNGIYQGGYSKIWKALKLGKQLIWQIMKQVEDQNYQIQQKIVGISNLVQILQELLQYSMKFYQNYSQTIFKNILYLLILYHKALHLKLTQDKFQTKIQFIIKKLMKLQQTIQQIIPVSNTLKILLFLSLKTFIGQPNTTCQLAQKQFQNILLQLLKSKSSKYTNYQQSFQILTYLLNHIQKNKHFIYEYKNQIFNAYLEYISLIQINKPVHLLLLDNLAQQKQQSFFITNQNQISDQVRYQILRISIQMDGRQYSQSLQKTNQLLYITFLSFMPQNPQQNPSSLTQSIITYLNLIIHHPISKNKTYLISCLKYLYRYIIDRPNQNLLRIYATILNIRTKYTEMQVICDIVLIKGINILVSCTQLGELYDFMQIWINNLYNNYMDTTAMSYYSILTILQTTQFYTLRSNLTKQCLQQNNLCWLFQIILQLLIEQVTVKKNKQISYKQQQIWYNNFQLFYKWSHIFRKYVQSRNSLYGMQQMDNRFSNNKNANNLINVSTYEKQIINKNNQSINKIISKALGHIFKNQLYCSDTAYLYLYQLTNSNDIDGVNQFMVNLMTQTFWRGFDVNQVIFYSCVFIGLIVSNQDRANNKQFYQCFLNILGKWIKSQTLTTKQKKKIKHQLQDFSILLKFSLHLDQNYLSKTSQGQSSDHNYVTVNCN